MQEVTRLSEQPAAAASLQVLPPVLTAPQSAGRQADPVIIDGHDHREAVPARPIHALSALILIAVDSLWALFDWGGPLVWAVAIPGCFLAVFVPTYLIQRHLQQDSKGRALAFATLLAVLAAIPTPITGTPVGLGLLAWTGLGKLFTKPPIGAQTPRPRDAS